MGAYGGDKDVFLSGRIQQFHRIRCFSNNPYTGELFGKFPWKEALSPYSVYAAALAKLTGENTRWVIGKRIIHSKFIDRICKYLYLGKKLFENRKDYKKAIGIFLLLVTVVQVFGDTAPESASRIFSFD